MRGAEGNRAEQSVRKLEPPAREGLGNLVFRVGKAEDAVFCHACADIVFFGIVLHDFEDAGKVLQNAHTMLKHDGLLANLDWKKQPMDFGPPLHIRFNEAEATRLIERSGFRVTSTTEDSPYHYLILARPSC